MVVGNSIVVDSDSFTTDVIQASYTKPVLVDFYATWCGPCQMLSPILEKLVREYDFILAKVDIDQNSELATTSGVQGVPDVRVVVHGEMLDGFVGVLPEPKIRELLTQLNLKSSLEMGLDAVRVAKTAGAWQEARQLYENLLQHYPDDRPLLLEMAQFLIEHDQLEPAERLLSPIQQYEREAYQKAQALKGLIQFKQVVVSIEPETALDALYIKGAQAALAQNYDVALESFLDMIRRDRSYRNDAARKSMLVIFDLLGDSHPLSKDYRKQLMLTLY
jgi:putative thioredoxin